MRALLAERMSLYGGARSVQLPQWSYPGYIGSYRQGSWADAEGTIGSLALAVMVCKSVGNISSAGKDGCVMHCRNR